MRNASLWRALLGVEKTVVEDVEFDEDEQVAGRPCAAAAARGRGRCGRCRRRSPGYDRGEGRRRWRALDLGTIQVCAGGRRAAGELPRARADGGGGAVGPARRRTHLASSTSRSPGWRPSARRRAITELMRIAWRTVGAIITRVWADVEALHDRFAGLRRIGIDEISYKRGHKYLTVVVDHDTGRLVWAAPGRDKATLDGVLRRPRAPERSLRPDHPRQRRRRGLDRRRGRRPLPERGPLRGPVPRRAAGPPRPSTRSAAQAWNTARRRRSTRHGGPAAGPRSPPATPRALKHARYALWKNPENLTSRQQAQAGLDRQDRPPAAPGLPAQGRTPAGLPARPATKPPKRSTGGSAGPAAAASHAFVELQRRIVKHQRLDPRRDRARPVQRPHRIGQHQDPTHHPDRVRLPLTPTPSSPSPCSPSAATDPPSPADNDPRISQESRICEAVGPQPMLPRRDREPLLPRVAGAPQRASSGAVLLLSATGLLRQPGRDVYPHLGAASRAAEQFEGPVQVVDQGLEQPEAEALVAAVRLEAPTVVGEHDGHGVRVL